MKKKLSLWLLLLIATVANAQISLGTGTTKGRYPVSTFYGYTYSQQIFQKSEINANAAGNITGVKFYLSASAVLTNSQNWSVYLGHTTKNTFTAITDWIPVASLTKVYEGNITNASGVVTITFTTPFPYNNVDNLVLAVDENTPNYDSNGFDDAMYVYSGASNSSISYRDDTVNPDPTATLPDGTRSSSKSRVTFEGLAPSAIPACPVVSAPAANATGVSVVPTFTWAAAPQATGYRISIGTTSGGTDILSNADNGNVTTYTLSTPLQFNTQYYYTVSSYNGAVPSAVCTVRSFTTGSITCPAVSSPSSGATGVSLTPSITWAASPGAAGYRISIGTTAGGTDVVNNTDLGNALVYNHSPALNYATVYYYTVNSYSGSNVSSGCTERSFTTVCDALTPVYANDFATFPGSCWALANGGSPATGTGTGTTNYWYAEDFLYGASNSATINLYSTDRAGWLLSPAFNLSAGGYRLKFNYGVTEYFDTVASAMGSDDVVQLLVSTNGGTTWSVLQTWNAANGPSNNSTPFVYDLSSYTGTNVRFAFYGTDGTVDDSEDYNFFVDDFEIDLVPACDVPLNLQAAPTHNTAVLSWQASVPTPVNGYEYYYSTVNTPPTGAGTPFAGTSVSISPLTPTTQYYVWVRSMCAGVQSAWSSASFTTLAVPPSNDNCSSPIALSAGVNFDANPVTATTVGATTTTDATATHTCQSIAYRETWHSVVVPAGGNLTIETRSVSGSAITDTVLGVYTGVCGALTQVGCDDDTSDDGNFSKVVLTGQTPGAVLLISVWNYSSTTNGEYRIAAYDALDPTLSASEVKYVSNEIKAYPNPFTDVLTISDVKDVKSIVITDMSGKIVRTLPKAESTLQLNDLNAGMYLLILNMNDGSKQTIKAIKR